MLPEPPRELEPAAPPDAKAPAPPVPSLLSVSALPQPAQIAHASPPMTRKRIGNPSCTGSGAVEREVKIRNDHSRVLHFDIARAARSE